MHECTHPSSVFAATVKTRYPFFTEISYCTLTLEQYLENKFKHIKMQINVNMSSIKKHFNWSINNHILSRVTKFNDLGIIITTNLSWCENVKTVSSKVHPMMGMINHSIGLNKLQLDVKRQLYLAHVRSILEYCSPMWSPSHVKDIIKS